MSLLLKNRMYVAFSDAKDILLLNYLIFNLKVILTGMKMSNFNLWIFEIKFYLLHVSFVNNTPGYCNKEKFLIDLRSSR